MSTKSVSFLCILLPVAGLMAGPALAAECQNRIANIEKALSAQEEGAGPALTGSLQASGSARAEQPDSGEPADLRGGGRRSGRRHGLDRADGRNLGPGHHRAPRRHSPARPGIAGRSGSELHGAESEPGHRTDVGCRQDPADDGPERGEGAGQPGPRGRLPARAAGQRGSSAGREVALATSRTRAVSALLLPRPGGVHSTAVLRGGS